MGSPKVYADRVYMPVSSGEEVYGASPTYQCCKFRGSIVALDADTGMQMWQSFTIPEPADHEGQQIWSTKVAMGGLLGGVMWGSASDGHNMYVAVSDYVAEGKLNPKAGGLVALRLSDRKELWRTVTSGCGDNAGCSAAQPAAVSLIPGVVFSGSRDGHLRAYETSKGQVIWDFDTSRDFQTANGVEARGGSIDAGGPAIANGMLLSNSGYAMFGGTAGNVLLAFGVNSAAP